MGRLSAFVASLPTAVCLAVIMASIGVFIFIYLWMDATLRSEALRNLDRAEFELRRAVYEVEILHTAAADAANPSHALSQSDFRRRMTGYAQGVSNNGIRAIALAQKVRDAEREAFIARRNAMPADARYPGARFEIAPGAPADIYYPALVVVPEDGNGEVPGFDLWSDAARRAAAQRSISEGRSIASTPVILSQDANGSDAASLLIITPIMSTLEADGLPRLLIASSFTFIMSLSGFTVTTIDPGEAICVFDRGPVDRVGEPIGSGSEQSLLVTVGNGQTDCALGISERRSIEFFGRSWEIVSAANRWGNFGGPILVGAALIAMVVLMAVSSIAFMLRLSFGRRLLEATLKRTDQDLADTNRRLAGALDKAHDAAAAQDRFIAHMSHDLRTPLNAISGFASILAAQHLRKDGHDSAKTAEYAGYIEHSAARLKRLIDGLLNYAAAGDDGAQFTVETLDVGALLDDVLREAVTGHPGLEAQVTDKRATSRSIRSNRGMLEQIFANILENTAKYAAHAGAVQIDITDHGDDSVQIVFIDQGPGLPPNIVNALGQPFQRGAGPYTTTQEGFGLGLSISTNLCRKLGVAFSFENGQHGGLIVTLTVPPEPPDAPTSSMT